MNDYVAIWYDREKKATQWINALGTHPPHALLVRREYASLLYAYVDFDPEALSTLANMTALLEALARPLNRAIIEAGRVETGGDHELAE